LMSLGPLHRVISLWKRRVLPRKTLPDWQKKYWVKIRAGAFCSTKRLAVEAAQPMGWERYVGPEGLIWGIDEFGASAPGDIVMEKKGFTPENITRLAKEILG